MVTILIAPLMSCSARAPVYALMIAAFFPPVSWLGGWVHVDELMMLAMTFFGAIVAIPIAWVMKRFLFKGEAPPFVMELPSYKVPSLSIVFYRVYDRASDFVIQAGTLILATSILIWAASYFPNDHTAENLALSAIRTIESAEESEQNKVELERLKDERNQISSELLANSFLGRFGRFIEPAIRPLGWDWRIGIGVIAAFPAREVIVATLGTIYSLGGDVDEGHEGLQSALRAATWPDGRAVYSIPVALSIMIFFALCAQCASTLAVIRRETGHWGWAVFTFVYMTVLAYLGGWLAYNIAGYFMG
jgi:ferrous iron transport protein B